ncbi:hypothetical protein [Cellulomonas alba]|uniref:Uncharacterized protein n=1 Tax=Cellulomonas alba TaxID=3053467 RepID=A0ABT7SH39_9CELL|nr:hypothetical protein [Cellulomonas alba]MDM7855507.1 hypothetical protein [Cellulomonas alba]
MDDAPVPRDDRVLRLTSGVSWAIVPFLLLAFAVLYPDPAGTRHLFAWDIASRMTAMTLASAYLGGAYYFVRAGLARRWHTIKAGFPPVALFATILGVTTFVRWDTFAHGRVAFWLWVLLYVVAPFLIAVVWWRNRRFDVPAAPGEPVLPEAAALFIGAVGVLAVVTGGVLVLFPRYAASVWPWPLTPLTSPVMGAVLCLGSAATGAFVERRWSSARLPFQVAGVMLALMVVAAFRARDEWRGDRPLSWLFAVGFVATLVLGAALYLRMERVSRQPVEVPA